MMTGKQRAGLRAIAQKQKVATQIGKEGISPKFLAQAEIELVSHELVKLKVLPNSGISSREACDALCAELSCEPISVSGNTFVIFRQKDKDSAFKEIMKNTKA